MSKKAKQDSRGRPRIQKEKAFTRRHVLNISPEMEDRTLRYAERNGIGRLTDALRQLLVKALNLEDGN